MGWTSYTPRPGAYRSVLSVEATPADGLSDDDRLRLSDVGKLARRARRKVVGAARADDQPSFGSMLSEHLGGRVEGLDVVEETWPTYDQVNVQAGLDAWLAEPGREHRPGRGRELPAPRLRPVRPAALLGARHPARLRPAAGERVPGEPVPAARTAR